MQAVLRDIRAECCSESVREAGRRALVLLKSFAITRVLECIADPSKIRVMASLSDHIQEVFPYLNAVMKGIAYSHGAQTMTLMKEHRLITLYPHLVTIAKADDEADAMATLKWLQEIVNDTWAKRESIKPSYETRQILRPLDVYSLLPKTNCKGCGEATCLAFALALLQGTRSLDSCVPLKEPAYASGMERLAELLGADGIVRGG